MTSLMIKSIHDAKMRKTNYEMMLFTHIKRITNPPSDQLGHQDLLKKCFPENWASTGHPDAHLAESLGVNND